jgi:hypothetical protein
MTETRTYTGGPGGFDGYAGLTLGTSYLGEEQTIPVPSKEEGAEPILVKVSPEQWGKWFRK